MKLKDNLKNFAKYVANSFNLFAKKISEKKESFISKTDENLDVTHSNQKELIKNKFNSFYERLRMIEYNLFGSGVNDILVICPKNKLNGIVHKIGDNSSSLKNYYDAIPNESFRYNNKQKYKNDDYMLLSSNAEKIEIPYFNCETKEVKNKFDQWINDDGIVVRNTGKQMIRNANGISMIHTTGLNPTTKTEGFSSYVYLEKEEIEIPHYDYSTHTTKVYVNKKKVGNLKPEEYIKLDYNEEYLKVSHSEEWDEENSGLYVSCIIKIKIIVETYSYFDENEYIIIKTPEDNLPLNIYRPKIYLNVKMVYNSGGKEFDIDELPEESPDGTTEEEGYIKKEIFKKANTDTYNYNSPGCWVRDFSSDGDFISEDGVIVTGLTAIIETNIPKDKILNFYESTSSGSYKDYPEFGDAIKENTSYRIPINLSISSKPKDGENRSGVILITFSHKKEELKDSEVTYNNEEESFLSDDSAVFPFRFIQGNSNNVSFSDFGIFDQIDIDGRGFLSESITIGSNFNLINTNKSCLFLKENAYQEPDSSVIIDALNKTSTKEDIYFNKNIGVCKSRKCILLLEKPAVNGLLHKGRNIISVLIISQRTALIPGDEFIPIISSSTSYKKLNSISFSKDQKSKSLYIVTPNPLYTEERTEEDEETKEKITFNIFEKREFQNWNPANYSSNVRFDNDELNYPIEYNSLPPSAFDMFYKATDGITLSISKSKTMITKDVGTKLTVLPAETTKYRYFPQGNSALPLDFYCEKGKWAKLISNSSYIVDMLIYDKSSWGGESKSSNGDYKNKNFHSGCKISIDENFIHGKKNFVILKKYQSRFYPQSEYGYVDPIINDVVFTFAEIRSKSNLLHFSDCLYIATKDTTVMETNNSIGPYDFGKFIINNSKFNKLNKSYYIKISEILASKAFISGMQESVAGSLYIDTDEIVKKLSLIFKIGSGEKQKILCNVDLNINFNSQEETQFGTITLWTSKSKSALKKTYRYHYSIEATSFKWNLFEGKQYEDEEDVFIELPTEDIVSYGVVVKELENSNVYTLPIYIDFVGDDPSIVSQIVVKSYERIHF